MVAPALNPRALRDPLSARIDGGTAQWLARDASGRLVLFIARAIHALRSHAESGSFERIDSGALDADAFHASDSLGLDGAPSMVFSNAMPPYSRDIDRPSSPGR